MKKVILMGLSDTENIGDQFVPKCVQYMVSGEETKDWENKLVSLIPPKKDFRYLIYGGLKIIVRLLPKCNFAHRISYVANKIREWSYYKKNIKSADAVIFSLGSYKYTTQDLWAYYALVIQIAEKKQIPVMFNAMNIQDFDETDWRCQILKKYTNYSCVKVFTTRDGERGINELRKYYITNPKIKIFSVGDAAYWIPECYNVKREEGFKIGINLIRGSIFKDYGKETPKEKLFYFYTELISILDEQNIEWELFTNGMRGDLEFGKELLGKIGKRECLIRVPESDRELPQIISRYKGVIGARLHACICAYSLDVPIVGFVWDKKILRFAQVAKLENNFLKEDDLNATVMIKRLENALISTYDKTHRKSLKEATKNTIATFLKEI